VCSGEVDLNYGFAQQIYCPKKNKLLHMNSIEFYGIPEADCVGHVGIQ
jgi:hypothetical protein